MMGLADHEGLFRNFWIELSLQRVTMRRFVFLLVLMAAGHLLPARAAAESANVIFILADDLGIGNVACYGADHARTPRIDELARQGIKFTRAFTGALCGPSRALIMSGRYAFRTGATNQDATSEIAPSELVLPWLFKRAGYVSSYIGKWGQLPGTPLEAGFTDSMYFKGSGVYWNPKGERERYFTNGVEKKLDEGEYLPDLLQAHVRKFIRAHSEQPFFVFYSLSHVHGELQPTPDSPAGQDLDLMGENIAYMVKLVGELIDRLEQLQLRRKTLVIFMGDNGTGKGQADRATIGGRKLSGTKGTMQDGGGLVPLIASWPAMGVADKVCDELIDSTDLVATFAALVDVALPTDRPFDGMSFLPQLTGKPSQPRRWIFNQLARMWYVREERWKLNHQGELYDMSAAPFAETIILPSEESSEARAARQRLAEVLARLDPAGGILDQGDGTGRHSGRSNK
jgi:arylsulfatase A